VAHIPTPRRISELRDDVNLPGLVLAQALRTPDAVAVRQWDSTLTYAGLTGAAGRLADRLRGRGVGPESTVGVCLPRTPELVVAVLGVLLAGGAYVPLDPRAPALRREALLRDAGATVVVTEADLADLATDPGDAGHARDAAGAGDAGDLPSAGPARPDHAAYVMYTSGSTGRPKGVVVTHGSVVNWVTAFAELTGAATVPGGCRSFGFATLGFDASVIDLFVPLSVGGEIELLSEAERADPTRLQEFVERHGVTWGFVTPAVLGLLDPDRLPAWHCLAVGGEVPSPALVARWTGGTAPRRFLNVYGPTETTVIVCAFEASGRWDRPLPLGHPIAGHRARVVDARLRPVRAGVAGELLIGGPGVARCYLGDPARTAERFVPDPVSGERAYRTGDLVVADADGLLTFVGRTDRQVKIRGQRTEPGEIETVLREHPQVGQVVVDAVPGQDGPRLVGFVTGHATGGPPDGPALRDWCAQRLPAFMVPAILPLDVLPLGTTGKVDLDRLRAMAAPGGDAGPATTSEAGPDAGPDPGRAVDPVTRAWCSVLGVASAAVDDDFFASGGHSVSAMRLVATLRAELDRNVAIEDVFAGRTLGRLAERVAAAPRLEAEVPSGSQPALSPAQRRLWLLDQLAPESTAYNVALTERLHGRLDVPALRAALAAVARRHDVLRWRIVESGGTPRAVVDPPGEIAMPVQDLTVVPDPERALHAALDAEAATRIDLATGPLWRARLFRLGAHDHVLAITVHHVVFDGWSQSPLYADLARAYAAELAPPGSTFADYVAWRAERDTRRGDADLRWWARHLAGAPTVVDLPRDRPRPPVQTYRGRTAHTVLDGPATARVLALASSLATTPATVLLTAFGELLRRLTGRRDLVIGTPAADRRQLAFHDLVGFFVEIVPLRLRPDPDAGFVDAVRDCRDVVLDALSHPAAPLDGIVDVLGAPRDPGRAPLVQVLFNVYNFPEPRLRLPGLRAEPIRPAMPGSPFDLTVYVVRRPEPDGRFAVDVLYNPDLYDDARIDALLAAYTDLVTELAGRPDRPAAAACPHLRPPPGTDHSTGPGDGHGGDHGRTGRGRDGTDMAAPPATPTERAVEGVWREVLGVASVGVLDNFFDAGGNSFALAAVRGRLHEVLGRDLRLVDLFVYPTVRALAAFVDRTGGSDGSDGSDGTAVDGRLDHIGVRMAHRRERSRRRSAVRARAGTDEGGSA
jgi:mycobactin peptide synthetase MbtE